MKRSKAEVLEVLRRVGLFETAEEIEPVLPDVVDLDRDHELLERHGLSQEVLMSRMGASQ